MVFCAWRGLGQTKSGYDSASTTLISTGQKVDSLTWLGMPTLYNLRPKCLLLPQSVLASWNRDWLSPLLVGTYETYEVVMNGDVLAMNPLVNRHFGQQTLWS